MSRHRAESGWPYLLAMALAVTFAVVLLMSGKPAAEPAPTPSTCVPASTVTPGGDVWHSCAPRP